MVALTTPSQAFNMSGLLHSEMNTGGFATLHVHNKYFGGFAVNSKSGFASNEKVEIHILDTI